MLERYAYQSLDTEQHEIRLLTILSGRAARPVQAIIKHASIAEGRRPEYWTISYVWGDPVRSGSLSIQESHQTAFKRSCKGPANHELALKRVGLVYKPKKWRLEVPANTEAALRRVRLEDGPLTVWIDAVCINQGDVVERSGHVAMMGRIYSGSIGNLINLGALDDGDLTVRIWLSVQALKADAERQTDGYRTFLPTVIDSLTGEWKYAKGGLQCKVYPHAVQTLLECRWFRRLWTLQEAALAPSNTALLGFLQFDLLGLLRAMVWWRHHASGQALSPEALAGLRSLHQSHNYVDREHGWAAGKRRFLGGLLLTAMFFEKTEPKDGVLAILALVDDEVSVALAPDYTKSLAEILQAATRLAVSEAGHLTLLRRLSHRVGDLERREVASWAFRPDRRVEDDAFARELPTPFRACADFDGYTPVKGEAADSSVLRLTGYVGAKVMGTTRPCSHLKVQRPFLIWVREALELYTSVLTPSDALPDTYKCAVALTAGGRLANGPQTNREEDLGPLISALDALQVAGAASVEADKCYEALTEAMADYDWSHTHNRVFFVTAKGEPGLGPLVMQPGDIVAVLRSAGVPYILRPLDNGQYQLVGAAYVCGMMWGELVEECRARGQEAEVFPLV
ncbi:hypothetical protein LTR53_007044 [Teratosphaeriaceae sp. CCFEE 6253]|nr:hypothetical protein LTR53_007044 [Teratosphaeriaceae sp. CCFEE 6253]